MKMSTGFGLLAGVLALFLAGTALAEEGKRGPLVPDDQPESILIRLGTALTMGGGVTGFTDEGARDYANVGGAWDLRLVVGTRRAVAVEAAYSGNAADINALGLDNSAALVSTGLEAAVRYNVLTGSWQPYVVAGAGWRRYDLTSADFNTSDVNNRDNVMEIPVGAGMSYRHQGLVADLRATFRSAVGTDLINPHVAATRHALGSEQQDQENQDYNDNPNLPGGSGSELNSWTISLSGGWEF